MSSTPLLVRDRDALVKMIMSHRYDKQQEEFEKRKEELFHRIHASQYTTEELEWMKNAPEGALREVTYYSVTLGLSGRYCQFGMRNCYSTATKGLRAFASRSGKTVVLHGEISDAATKLYHDETDFINAKNKARLELEATLKKFRYIEKLVKDWPEIKSFIDKISGAAQVVNLPAINYEMLNKQFELPPETVSA